MPREKQIEFPPEQSPPRWVTPFFVGLALLFAVVTIILVAADVDGPFIGPW